MHADIENDRYGHAASKRFTNVVLPEPEGAAITINLPVDNEKLVWLRIKQKKLRFMSVSR